MHLPHSLELSAKKNTSKSNSSSWIVSTADNHNNNNNHNNNTNNDNESNIHNHSHQGNNNTTTATPNDTRRLLWQQQQQPQQQQFSYQQHQAQPPRGNTALLQPRQSYSSISDTNHSSDITMDSQLQTQTAHIPKFAKKGETTPNRILYTAKQPTDTNAAAQNK